MKVTDENLLIRLQNLKCCISTLSEELLAKIKIGSKDVDCKLQDLQVIERMYKYLRCYEPLNDVEILATGTIQVDSLEFEDVIDILINNVSIVGGPQAVVTTNITTVMNALITYINNHSDVYTASYDGTVGKGAIVIVGTCEDDVISYTIDPSNPDDPSVLIVTGLSGGACLIDDTDNCLTEAEVQTMFDYIAVKCKNCFSLSI